MLVLEVQKQKQVLKEVVGQLHGAAIRVDLMLNQHRSELHDLILKIVLSSIRGVTAIQMLLL